MLQLIFGMDPGKSGAIAWATNDGRHGHTKMPADSRALLEYLRAIRFEIAPDESFAFIEHVGGLFIGNIAKKQIHQLTKGDAKTLMNALQRSSANLSLRENLGELRMGCTACGITVAKEPRPQHWMKRLDLAQTDSAKRKTEIYERMQQQFPDWKFPKYAADAVALVDYGQTWLRDK